MNVIAVPGSLDYHTVDELYAAVQKPSDTKSLVDLRHLRFVDPNGMLALLAVGRLLRERQGEPGPLSLPESGDVQGYLARMGFFDQARSVYEFGDAVGRRGGRTSDVLLEITPISENQHVHDVVDRVEKRAGAILTRTLDYPPTSVVKFSVVLSEVCQNILEHAEAPGWVAAQVYNWERRIGRQVLVIAVADVGRGFKGSLSDEYATRFSDRWGDATALEAAFIHGLTRFPDSGRGHGIQQIRRQVGRWDGLISVRSGTARIRDVPSWEDGVPLETDLPRFPGAQINIVLPARETPAEDAERDA